MITKGSILMHNCFEIEFYFKQRLNQLSKNDQIGQKEGKLDTKCCRC